MGAVLRTIAGLYVIKAILFILGGFVYGQPSLLGIGLVLFIPIVGYFLYQGYNDVPESAGT